MTGQRQNELENLILRTIRERLQVRIENVTSCPEEGGRELEVQLWLTNANLGGADLKISADTIYLD